MVTPNFLFGFQDLLFPHSHNPQKNTSVLVGTVLKWRVKLVVDDVQRSMFDIKHYNPTNVTQDIEERDHGLTLLKYRSFRTYSEKKSKKIALHPLASKFGPQEVNRFSQSHTAFHAI